MAEKQINAILWRSYLAATSRALWRETNPDGRISQYYIDLPKGQFQNFFGAGAKQALDKDGNETFTITLERFDGIPPVDEYQVTFKKLAKGKAREDTWNINGQSLEDAYALWQPNRGPLKKFPEMTQGERDTNFLVIVRDTDFRFHGRWLQPSDFAQLPVHIRNLLSGKDAGWAQL